VEKANIGKLDLSADYFAVAINPFTKNKLWSLSLLKNIGHSEQQCQ